MEVNENRIDVLPGTSGPGFIELVSYMQPVNRPVNWTCDLEIIRNARVSYDGDWRTGEDADKDAKLINYLVKNKHTSPLECVSFTFHVKAPIFVFRQWHRHRTVSINEISARYAKLDEGFYVPEWEQITQQSKDNKQMRTNEMHPDAAAMASDLEVAFDVANQTYNDLIERGCPRELARSVLPVSAYSRMFFTQNLHNLFHFLNLRLHEHAQYEIRVYAEAILKLIEPYAPITVRAFREHRLGK